MSIIHPLLALCTRPSSASKQAAKNGITPNFLSASKAAPMAVTETTSSVTFAPSCRISSASLRPSLERDSFRIRKLLFLTQIIVSPCMAFAAPQIKTIEVGPGTQNPTSVARFFPIPSKVGVQVLVQLKRTGTPGANFDVPVDIELRQPGAGGDADGPIIASRSGIKIGTTNTSINFTAIGNQNGCNGSPWKVRVKYLNDNREENNFSVTGTAALVANDEERTVGIEGGLITLNKGNSVTKSVGNSSGFGQGNIKVTGAWNHSISGVPGPLPVQLKFELIKPAGAIADSETAYKTGEILADPDLFFTYHVTSSTNGQWKLRITNNSDHDVMNIDPKIIFNPRCFD